MGKSFTGFGLWDEGTQDQQCLHSHLKSFFPVWILCALSLKIKIQWLHFIKGQSLQWAQMVVFLFTPPTYKLVFCPFFHLSWTSCSHSAPVRLVRTFLPRTISSLSYLSGWQKSKKQKLCSHILTFTSRAYLLSGVTTVSLCSSWPPPLKPTLELL